MGVGGTTSLFVAAGDGSGPWLMRQGPVVLGPDGGRSAVHVPEEGSSPTYTPPLKPMWLFLIFNT